MIFLYFQPLSIITKTSLELQNPNAIVSFKHLLFHIHLMKEGGQKLHSSFLSVI